MFLIVYMKMYLYKTKTLSHTVEFKVQGFVSSCPEYESDAHSE